MCGPFQFQPKFPDSSAPVLKKERSHSFHGKADRKSSSKQLRVRHTLFPENVTLPGKMDCVRSGARSILLTEDNLNNLENHAIQRGGSGCGPDLILDLPSR